MCAKGSLTSSLDLVEHVLELRSQHDIADFIRQSDGARHAPVIEEDIEENLQGSDEGE